MEKRIVAKDVCVDMRKKQLICNKIEEVPVNEIDQTPFDKDPDSDKLIHFNNVKRVIEIGNEKFDVNFKFDVCVRDLLNRIISNFFNFDGGAIHLFYIKGINLQSITSFNLGISDCNLVFENCTINNLYQLAKYTTKI